MSTSVTSSTSTHHPPHSGINSIVTCHTLLIWFYAIHRFASIQNHQGNNNLLGHLIVCLCIKAINKSVGGGRLLRTSIYTKVGGVQFVSIDGGIVTQNKATQFSALTGTSFVEIECQGGGAGGAGGAGVSADGVNPSVAGGGGAQICEGVLSSFCRTTTDVS
ncbi:hypothetical protein ACUNEY_24775 [Serratia sp. IR-2025]